MLIGIVGNGFVGKATALLECKNNKVVIFDKDPQLCKDVTTMNDLKNCDIIFVCVPTPMATDGSCHTKILEDVVNQLKLVVDEGHTSIVSRCTCPVGTSRKLDIHHMPEFLTEINAANDFRNCPHWFCGINSKKENNIANKLTSVLNNAYDAGIIYNKKITFFIPEETEMIKQIKNVMLATKVSLCNEIYEYCKCSSITYDNIMPYITEDNRIGSSHTQVPGPDGKFGYGGSCFPKDCNSVLHQMKQLKMKSFLLEAAIKRNEMVDRLVVK